MDRFAVSEVTTFRWSFEQDLDEYRRAGVAGMGVWRQKISDVGEETGIELLAHSGLAVSSLAWAGGFTGSDGRGHSESIADAREAIRLARKLNAGCLLLHTGPRAGHTHKHVRRLFRSALDKLLPLAEELGVVLALEPMCTPCGSDWTFLNTLEETLQWTEEINSEALQIALDTYHVSGHADLFDWLPRIAPRTVLVQLGDRKTPPDGEHNRCLLGDGRLPIPEIIGCLETHGYRGRYELELLGEDVEVPCYRELLAASRRRLADWLGAAV